MRKVFALLGGVLFALPACQGQELSAYESYNEQVLKDYSEEQIEDCSYMHILAVERDRNKLGPEGDLKINDAIVRIVFQRFYGEKTGKMLLLEEIADASTLRKDFTLKMMESGDRDGLSVDVMLRLNKCAALINSIALTRSLRNAYDSGTLEAPSQ